MNRQHRRVPLRWVLVCTLWALLLTGCASWKRFGVTASVAPTAMQPAGTFAIRPAQTGSGISEAESQDTIARLRKGLTERGWIEAPTSDVADFVVEMTLKMDPAWEVKSVTSVPITRQVANPANTPSSVDTRYQNPGITSMVNVTTGQRDIVTEQTPSTTRGPPTIDVAAGEETFVGVQRVVPKVFAMTVQENPARVADRLPIRTAWVAVRSSDDSRNLARYLPMMVAVALEALDRGERGISTFEASDRGGRIVVVRR